jgi:PST family polysaccharide transporter
MAAVPYFRILAVSMFAAPIMQMFGLLMLSSGQTKRYLKWGVITNLSVIFSLLFGIKWGTLGVAIAWPIAMAINFAISMFYVFRGTAISGKNIINCIYRPAIASIIMGMILYLLLGKISLLEICYQILFSSLLGLACYLMIWLFFKNGKNMVYEYIAYPLYLLKRKY